MKHLIATILFLFPLTVSAQLSDEMLAILAMEEPAKTEALNERRESFVGYLTSSDMRDLCLDAKRSRSELLVDFIKIESANSDSLSAYSIGEFIYFAECDGRNAFEHNIYPTNLRYTALEGTSENTLYIISQMGALLAEKGLSGMTALEFVQNHLDIAARENTESSNNRAIIYSQIKREIGKAIDQ